MSSLFSTLLRLRLRRTDICPSEDFFTEVIAHTMRQRNSLVLKAFLQACELDVPETADIQTQVHLGALESGTQGSIPDLVVTYTIEQCSFTIFVESKLGSHEGVDQLKRYAGHLGQARWGGQSDIRRLVYVTRRYDPKYDLSKWIENEPWTCGTPRFHYLMWSYFYVQLKKIYDETGRSSRAELAREVLKFMKENDMSRANYLPPHTVSAIAEMPRAFAFITDTLEGEVKERFERLCGKKETEALKTSLVGNLKEKDKLVLQRSYGSARNVWICLGWHMPNEAPSAYPEVGLWFWVGADAKNEDLRKCMQQALKDRPDKWRREDDDDGWGAFVYATPIESLLAARDRDHVKCIQGFLLEALSSIETCGVIPLANKLA